MPENSHSDTLKGLRTELFATLRGLRDKENPIEVNRAKAIAQVAETIINSAKVEVAFMRESGSRNASEFLETPERPEQPRLAASPDPRKGLSTGKHLGAA